MLRKFCIRALNLSTFVFGRDHAATRLDGDRDLWEVRDLDQSIFLADLV